MPAPRETCLQSQESSPPPPLQVKPHIAVSIGLRSLRHDASALQMHLRSSAALRWPPERALIILTTLLQLAMSTPGS
jgi:hypothetical protein